MLYMNYTTHGTKVQAIPHFGNQPTILSDTPSPLVREELQRLDWPEEGLRVQPKGHRAKVMMARRLRQETTMSLKWIAKRLEMGSWTHVSNLLNGNPGSREGQPVLPLFQ